MNAFEKKDVLSAILIADTNMEQLRPLSDENSTALLPLVNVPMLNYALEALSYNGVEEVFLYSSVHIQNVRDYVKLAVDSRCSWSVNMNVHVIGGEGCRCFGDAMRDLDAKALIRGNCIIMGVDTVTNADLRAIFEQHKKSVSYDKGAAATLVFKEAATTVRLRSGNEVMIAMDVQNKRLHHHQRLRVHNKESRFEVPLEVFIHNSQVALLHNLLDPQIAIGSPSMLSLFSDNFDFATRDDFVRGLLINEEILDSRIYVALLPLSQYACKVNNWLAYQTVSQDIINRWAYPLVPDMGIHCLMQQYIFLKNNIYKSRSASAAKVALRENVVIQQGSSVDASSVVSYSVIGGNCRIGRNCRLLHAYLLDNVSVADNCVLEYCVIGGGCVIGANCALTEGSVLSANCVLPANAKLKGVFIRSACADQASDTDDTVRRLGDKAYVIEAGEQKADNDNTSDSGDDDTELLPLEGGMLKMMPLPLAAADSDYSASSDEDDEDFSRRASPQPDETNTFLTEVRETLARCFQEKSNPDYLILEINSLRYVYNMSLREVNFYVVKALFGLPSISETAHNVLVSVNTVLKQLGPVLTNYIKTPDAMLECLKALQDISLENQQLRDKISQIIHYMYDKDYVTEEAIVAWFAQLDVEEDAELRRSLEKLIEWLDQSSEEEDDDDSASA